MARRIPTIEVPVAADIPPGNITATEWAETKSTASMAATRVFDVREYGAVGDGVTDDTAAALACLADCLALEAGTILRRAEFFVPAGMNMKVSAQLNLRHLSNVNIRGWITSSYSAGPMVIVGHVSTSRVSTSVFIQSVNRADSGMTNPSVRIVGVKNGNYTINSADYIQMYADSTVDAAMNDSIAYSNFTFGYVRNLDITGVGPQSWINENTIVAKRGTNLLMNGPYKHNNNVITGVFEGSTITIESGESNHILARFEYSCDITFGANANFNEIQQMWNVQRMYVNASPIVVDNGFGNEVFSSKEAHGHYQTYARADATTLMTNGAMPFQGGSKTFGFTPGFHKIAVNNIVDVLDTGVFPLGPMPGDEGRIHRLRVISDEALWRIYVYTYDESRAPIQGLAQTGAFSWSSTNGRYEINSNFAGSGIPFAPETKYARVIVRAGTTGWFTYLELLGIIGPSKRPGGTQLRNMMRLPTVSGTTAPTASLLPQGQLVGSSDGVFVVVAQQSYQLEVARAAGSSTISMTENVTGVSAGDVVAIELANDQTHFTTVTSTSTKFINLATPTPFFASLGARVKTQRWKHIT